jgi:hypothetical protein
MTLWSTPSGRRLLAMIALLALAACASVPAPVQDVAEAGARTAAELRVQIRALDGSSTQGVADL